MPRGAEKRAAVPVPSTKPLGQTISTAQSAPAGPAKVVTTPSGVIFRMSCAPKSATYKLPALSATMPNGNSKRAAAPVPSRILLKLESLPAVPAKVTTAPAVTGALVVAVASVDPNRLSPAEFTEVTL